MQNRRPRRGRRFDYFIVDFHMNHNHTDYPTPKKKPMKL